MTEHTERGTDAKQTLPLIVLDGAVVFPYTVITLPLDDETERAAEAAMQDNQLVLLVARREEADDLLPLDMQLHRVGTVARIEQIGKLPNGASGVVVRGIVRAQLGEQTQHEPFPRFSYAERRDSYERTPALETLMTEVHAAIDAVLDMRPGIPQEIKNFVRSIDEAGHLADNTGYSPDYTFAERQELLETFDVVERLRKVRDFYRKQFAMLDVQAKLRQEVQDSTNKQQREFYLRQQMRAIQKELGEDDNEADELEALREKLASAGLTEAASKEADRELSRLSRMNNASPEYQMVRNYLEWLAELPWDKTSGVAIDVAHSREVLDSDHYGLEKIKERILEYLAVKQRRAALGDETGRSREPILCFVGPPGVGKTSLGQSIARALGRQFVRMSLGGVRDEAELRGFRRTYIGSQPGRIIQELRRASTADPVILLDEVDKIGQDWRGDPASALLEVLDPEQNNTFTDHYLNLPFDLSRVLFIATANDMSTVPPALRDRLEVIELSGYIADEKVAIARQHLVPRQLKANGLTAADATVTDEALRTIIADYTREAGVRTLERQIGTVLRKVTRQLAEGQVLSSEFSVLSSSGEDNVTVNGSEGGDPTQNSTHKPQNSSVVVDAAFVRNALGRQRFFNEAKERIDQPGIATGMVWTPVGGDIVFVEATPLEGAPGLKVTGQLGDVMRESAEAALTFVRSRGATLGIDPKYFDTHAVHIHVPAGAVPKDGPSAGITMATALASAATGRLVRDDVAMTGEISLRGRVLPIGGIKEKALGAHRAGIRTIILPRRNEPELEELPREVFEELTFVPVDTLDEVLQAALLPHPTATLDNLLAAGESNRTEGVEHIRQ
jgi:ATP-dependent Lon protease